jgi:hypothetical protein
MCHFLSLCCTTRISHAVSSVELMKSEVANLSHIFQGEFEIFANSNHDMMLVYIDTDIFVNCNWVDTR